MSSSFEERSVRVVPLEIKQWEHFSDSIYFREMDRGFRAL